jgi:hypothetical protein
MADIRVYRLHLRNSAANLRRLADRHSDGGNPEISRKLADVVAGLEAEADDLLDAQQPIRPAASKAFERAGVEFLAEDGGGRA